MNDFNLFDYLILSIVPIVLLYKAFLKKVLWLRFIIGGFKTTSKVVDVKATMTKSFQRRFAFLLSYKIDGNAYASFVEDYRTPLALELGDNLEFIVRSNNLIQIKTLSLEGKELDIFFESVIAFLLAVGSLYCLVLLNLLEIKFNFLELVVIGFLLLGFSGSVQRLSYILTLKRNSSKTMGKVVGYEETFDADRTKGQLPIIEFQVNGNVVKFTAAIFSIGHTNEIGSTVRVVFWNKFPKFAELDAFINIWGEFSFWFILFLISLMSLLLL